MAEYPWYEKVTAESPLEQGDLLRNCPILVPLYPERVALDNISGKVIDYDIIIISQSCDLASKRITFAQVAPVFTLGEMAKKNSGFGSKGTKNKLRKGASRVIIF